MIIQLFNLPTPLEYNGELLQYRKSSREETDKIIREKRYGIK